jgi:hypothetical protein
MAKRSKGVEQRLKRCIGSIVLCAACMASAYAAHSDTVAPAAQNSAPVAATPAKSELDTAYDLMRSGNDRAALSAFQQAFSAGQGNAGHFADAGLTAARLSENALAVKYMKAALDADAQDSAFNDEQRFAFRREVEQLERSWGLVLGAAYQTEAFSAQGTVASLEPSVEAYWQPPLIGYRNQRLFQVFVRAYASVYDGSGDIAGLPTTQLSVGARYKPLVEQNLVLSAERLIRVGSLSVDDWLARISFSTEAGTDIQVAVPSWRSWQAYADAAYFIKEGRYTFSTELRYGHTWRLPMLDKRVTIYPHVALAGDYDSFEANRLALGVGPGVGLRFWFRESRYTAPASLFDLTVQYRFPLTHAPRARGLIVRATLAF